MVGSLHACLIGKKNPVREKPAEEAGHMQCLGMIA